VSLVWDGEQHGDAEAMHEIGVTMRRQGGNTAYDWRTGFTSTGADWYFENSKQIALAPSSPAEAAGLALASVFTDNMVLQRDRKIPVWGTADDGARIAVQLNGKLAITRAVNGTWRATLPPMPQGGPYVLTVSSEKDRIHLANVLVGEVFIASGQSNMEFGLPGVSNGNAEVAQASYPNIRFFTVERATSVRPLDSVKGSWTPCTPQHAAGFSAVAYFFARELATRDGLNVGIIHTSWGGTPAEAWTDEATLRSDPDLAPLLEPLEAWRNSPASARQEIQRKMAEWERFWDGVFERNEELGRGFADPRADVFAWTAVEVPGQSSILATVDGVVWYRRELDLPPAWQGQDLTLALGPIDDFDITYWNGREIGRTTKSTPNWYMVGREYTVPGALVRPGTNTIAVRIVDSWLGGGFGGPAQAMQLRRKDSGADAAMSLAGTWLSHTAFQLDPQRDPVRPAEGDESHVATLLYNAMIAPLIPYGIRGAIWYQGEENTSRHLQYRKLFPAMIDAWRRAWGQGDFPFYFVQLANYMQRLDAPSESDWAGLREAQRRTLARPNTGMAVTIDIGDAGNIHPPNKQDVGKRLALWAEAKLYGRRNLAYSGPLYKRMKVQGDTIAVSFDHAQGGLLAAGGGKLEGFAIAGADGKFVWANARIDGERVVVSSPQVRKPRAVRYGWADNPAVNLTNRAGLPASPFQTDGP
jgi:sialate O-acetylesterase